MDMAKLTKIADGVASVSKRFDSFLERRKDRTDADDRTKKMSAVAKEHPDWSIKKIEEHLGLKPENSASAFKKGTASRAAEEKDYAERSKKKSDSARSDALSTSEAKAIVEGAKAYRAGKKLSDNPYKSDGGGKFNAGELNAMAWRTGFEQAKLDDSARSDTSGYVTDRIGKYKVVEGTGQDGGDWFAIGPKGDGFAIGPKEKKRFKTREQAKDHCYASQPELDN